MEDLKNLIRDLVSANRILAHEGVCDAYGHISVRNPAAPKRYFLSRSRSPEIVTEDDIIEFELDGTPVEDDGRPLYIERPIHGAIYEARPDVNSVVHNHAYEVLPFSVTDVPLRAMMHGARRIGEDVPVWDIRDKFGDTDMLVTTFDQGRDLATRLASKKVVLMRGHGCTIASTSIPDAVQTAIYLQENARLLLKALQLGEVKYLSPGEIKATPAGQDIPGGHNRAWEYYCRRAGVAVESP